MPVKWFILITVLTTIIPISQGLAAGEDGEHPTKGALAASIREHRMGDLIIQTSPGAEVKVKQIRHEFGFGTAISSSMVTPGSRRRTMSPEDRHKYQEVLAAHFNCAVHENALKWHKCEPRSDSGFDYGVADEIYAWCASEDISMRGHCIFWAKDKYVQKWVKDLDPKTLRAVVERRAGDITWRYRGRIEEFDLNNEMVDGDFFRRHLGPRIVKEMALWAKAGNPSAKLYVNDYSLLSGRGGNLAKCIEQIQGWLDQGVPFDGIGCQGHFGDRLFDPSHVQKALNRLAEFGLPIKITEYDCNSGDEELKARHLTRFYEICFAHPAVEAILMWGFWEGAHWKPKAALWKRDWTETPTARAYRDLVFNRWWTRVTDQADDRGILRLRAFYGQYEVKAGGQKKQVLLSKSQGQQTISF